MEGSFSVPAARASRRELTTAFQRVSGSRSSAPALREKEFAFHGLLLGREIATAAHVEKFPTAAFLVTVTNG